MTPRLFSLYIDTPKARCLLGEVGGHRIQRVPPTERRGRVHSSTVTVSVLENKGSGGEQAHPDEFVKEWFSGSGAGGQHRNRHKNALRLKHLPTGEVVTAQCRKRPQSEAQAWAEMRARLESRRAAADHQVEASIRREQVGLGEKADKRRTYRFQDDVVVDHTTGKRAKASRVMKGQFEMLW